MNKTVTEFDKKVQHLMEHFDCIHTREEMKEHITNLIKNDMFSLANYLIKSMLEVWDTEYYLYDMSLGADDYPYAIKSEDDLDYIYMDISWKLQHGKY